ncbi:hypothetical protein FPOA_13041 [Fusarium poae]|uniref:HTH CENPB-type domain-containing protein n=1 Tax=Fusarium poae TaxID=36050 RepID=A0A1B8A6X6_FUSPO|nr:hypothetical protein FPOA_13041 [Fusarium poae]
MPQSSNEARILLALQALQNNPKLSLRRASTIYQVSFETLRRRHNGIQSRRDCIPKSRKLSDLEEQIIVQFILDLDSRGFPSRLRFVEEMANSLLADRDASPVGKRWAHNFVKRQPELKTRLFRKYDYQRAKCEDPSIIRGWFRLIQNTIAKYGIRPDDIWNFDETGFMMGIIMAGMVVTGSERQGRPKSVQPGNREWITVIQAINAEGQSIAPFIIGAGQYHLANWYRECDLPGDWVIATSQNGWTNNQLGLEWLKHFDRSTTKRSVGSYRLLILDGHESHHSADFERYCKENKIITLCMPAHASHLLQPLDIGCFGPLKKAYGREIERLIRCSITHISKTEFFSAFYAAFKAAFTKSNIRGGFRGAGLAPFDPENVISKLDVQLRTPTPPEEAAEPSTSWTSKTPKTVIEAQSHTLSEPEASSTEHTVKRRKLRAIATWDHFRGAQGDEPRAISGNLLHYCKRCRNPSWSTHISGNARYHLKKAHHIFVREDSSSQNKRQLAIENAFARTTAKQLQQVREHERNTLRSVINVDAFREAQMLLSAHRHLPLNFVTWPEYQALLTAVNPAIQEFLTDSGNTVAADLDRAYDAHQQSRLSIHIPYSIWNDSCMDYGFLLVWKLIPYRKAYVAVHAQWVDEAYKPRKALLGLPNLRRSHAGAAMTPHLMGIIRKYHLAPRIGYFTGDNDAKNDTCLRQLAVGLSQEYGLTFDPVSSRTRCAGHIINLSLQAFLFATSEDALQAAIEQAQDEANDVTVSDALHDRIQSNTCQKSHGRRNKRNDTGGWRSIGPMGKLHNIAVFIRNSTLRNDAWDDIAGKALGIDNITRWNSWFKLLDAAISQEGPLSIFLNQYHEELEGDILTHDDWQVLKMTHEFLQPFYQATLEQQMEWASIDQVLENMDILFLQFENAKVKYVNNARMVNSVHMGWWVLSKYYEESDKNPIYATALLLHPEKRRRYLDRHWAEEWRQTAIAGARRHWAKCKDRPLSSDSAARLSNERREVTPYERIKQSMSVLDEPGDEDEFEKFVNSPPRHMTTNTPLEWWCREEQRIEYPRLHQMAIDILSVPAMSDDPERVFSCARRTISWDRARLSTDTIEKLQCLSNWVKNDLIHKLYVTIDDEIMVVAGDDDDIPDPSLLY